MLPNKCLNLLYFGIWDVDVYTDIRDSIAFWNLISVDRVIN